MILADGKIEISVVVPVWNEDYENINELYLRLTNVLRGLNKEYEIIFVDDGSVNGILRVLKGLCAKDERARVVVLTKNFGQAIAFLAGFEYAKGDIIITMDDDLQNAPEDIPRFLDKINEGFEMVFGCRKARHDPLITRKIPSYAMNKIISARVGLALHDWGCSFNAAKKEVIEFLKDYGKNSRFIKPIMAKSAKSIAEIKIKHCIRKRGASKYGFFRLTGISLDFLLHYSLKREKADEPLFEIKEII